MEGCKSTSAFTAIGCFYFFFGLLMCLCKYPKSSFFETYLSSMLATRRGSAVCRDVVEYPEVDTAGGINQYRRT